MEETFLLELGLDLVVCAASCVLGASVTRRARGTRLWFPALILFGAIAIFAGSDAASTYIQSVGDLVTAGEFARSEYIGVGLSIPAAVQLVAVYPRNLRAWPIRVGIAGLYVVGIILAVLTPTRALFADAVAGTVITGPAYWPLQTVLTAALSVAIGWCIFLALKGRSQVEQRTGVGFAVMLGAPLLIGSAAAAQGVATIGSVDALSVAYAVWVGVAAFVVLTGRLEAPVPSTFYGLLNSVADAVIVAAADGVVTSANGQAENLFGVARGSLATRPLSDVLSQAVSRREDAEFVNMSVKGVLRGRLDSHEAKVDGVGPKGRTCMLRVLPLGSRTSAGEARAALVIIRDETDRLALERSTTRSRDLLDLVIRMLGHDLKAPLSVIQGYLDIDRVSIAEAKGSPDYAAIVAHMDKMAEAVIDMHLLMGNARSLSRLPGLDELDPKLTELDLTRTVRQMFDLLQPTARSHHVSLKASIADGIIASVVPGFDSVPRNLIDNGIKYTPPGGEVAVSLAAQDGKIVLRVADTGPGIPPGKEDQLFRKFERLGAEKGSTEGHGLGLSIVAKLVELSKGTIRLGEREDGRSGAIFVVELPASGAAAGAQRV